MTSSPKNSSASVPTTVSKNKAPAPRKEDRIKALVSSDQVKSRFQEILGKKSAGFLSSVVSAVNANQQLKDADPTSVIAAAAVAASLDLPVNPSLGMAHIVPYKGAAQFQVGWKGFVQLALRTGQYRTINATEVYDGQLVNHNPFTGEMEFRVEKDSEKVVGYLLYFKLLNGYEKYFYMTHEEVMAHGKRYSASFKKGFGVWAENFDAMALKTVVKLGLSKYGVLSIEMQKALEVDQAEVTDNGVRYVDGVTDDAPEAPSEPPPAKTSRLKELVANNQQEIEVTDEGPDLDVELAKEPPADDGAI